MLYSVPKCGPLRLRKVCKRGRSGRNWGRVRALLMMMVPKECPMKLTFVGFRPDVSMWWRISATNRSVIVSKSEKVSPFSTNVKIIYNNLFIFSYKNIVFYIKIFLCKRDRTISFPILSFKRIYNIKAFPLLFQLLPRWKSFYACKRTSKRNEMDSF